MNPEKLHRLISLHVEMGQLIKEISDQHESKSMQMIANNLCLMAGVTLDAVRAKNRRPWISDIRKILICKLREEGYTLTAIGEFLNRDHSSIMTALKNHANYYSTDKNFRSFSNKLRHEQ